MGKVIVGFRSRLTWICIPILHLRVRPRGQTDFPGASVLKDPPANAGDLGSIPGLGKKRKWQPTLVFLPGKSHGQRYLMGSQKSQT